MQQEEPSPTGRMSRKRPREPAPVPASPDESSSVSITIPERPKNGAGGAKNGTDSGVSGSNSGSSNNNGATQKRFSSIRIEDDGMETGSSDNFWPPSDESIRNGHVSFGECDIMWLEKFHCFLFCYSHPSFIQIHHVKHSWFFLGYIIKLK